MKTEPTQLAFPADSKSHTDSGMNLRQYYAGLAMQGFLAHYGTEYYMQHAHESVCMADAIIAELNKTQ